MSTVTTNGCNGYIKYLEHVQLCVTIRYPKRGMVEIDLKSPKSKYYYALHVLMSIKLLIFYGIVIFLDTTCKMMEPRRLDESNKGFFEWKIKSLQFWGENPSGEWTVIVKDEVIIVDDCHIVLTLLTSNYNKKNSEMITIVTHYYTDPTIYFQTTKI